MFPGNVASLAANVQIGWDVNVHHTIRIKTCKAKGVKLPDKMDAHKYCNILCAIKGDRKEE